MIMIPTQRIPSGATWRRTAVRASASFLLLLNGRADADDSMGLDTTRHAMVIRADPAFRNPPLTVECRVRLNDWSGYNILMAYEPKKSGTHWELFTSPRDGFLQAYLPGRRPNHVRSSSPLTTGVWHSVRLILEETRARLFLNGVEVGATETEPLRRATVPGPLVIGGLVDEEHSCNGWISGVRIARGVHEPSLDPENPSLLGLWQFAPGRLPADESVHQRAGTLRPRSTRTPAGEGMEGGMSAAFQPLPPVEDATPLRAMLAEAIQSLGLRSVLADDIRDEVLRSWSREYDGWNRVDHPAHRPGGPSPDKLEREVFDRHALIWPADGGPAGTALRRTRALLDHLSAGQPPSRLADVRAELDSLQVELSGDGASTNRGLHLAICAVRRRLVLSNPLLDFDQLVFVARGTFAGSVRSNPVTKDIQGGHFVTQYFGFNALPGGGLFIARDFKNTPAIVNVLDRSRVQNGRLQGTRLDHGAFATPDLSFDGRTLAFAWTANREHRWVYETNTCFHLFRVNADGSDLQHLTDGAWNDFDPCWLPDERIAFVSERRGGYIRCFAAYLKVRNYTMASIDRDGNDLRALSYFETGEWNPTVDNSGRIVYTRWDYVDRENCLGSRYWVCNPDGTNPRAPHGNYPRPYHTFSDHEPWAVREGRPVDSRRGAPMVEMGIRAAPDSPLHVFTAAPHHGEVFGSICMLDLRAPDDGHMSQIRRFTPDEAFPESEMPARRHYKYGTPWPLNEDFVICTRWEDIVLIDRFGNQELLVSLRELPGEQDERLRLIDPIPLRPRPRPPVIPPAVRCADRADAPAATLAVMNVYESDLPFPPGTAIKWLRVVQAVPKTNHAMGEPMIGYERENTPRIPLGIVPVEEDGSAYFEAPVAKQLIFQVLDDQFMAVQSMRSAAFVHPGEQLYCLGCHEAPHLAAPPADTPLALRRAASRLEPECGPIEPISYHRHVRPIVERSCLPCHRKTGQGPVDMSYEALRDSTFWFSGGMAWTMITEYSGSRGGSRSIPGRFGARHSRMGRALLTGPHMSAVPERERRLITLWLDCNSLRLGAYENEAAQLRGDLVWPSLDVNPLNPAGIERLSPGLQGLFWHEAPDPRQVP